MGMDGLSMANTGALKESTSAELTGRTEQTIQSDPTNDRKQVQNTSTNRAVREKDEDEESPKQEQQNLENNDEEFDDAFVEGESQENNEEYEVEDIENPNKDFYVKLNSKSDTIELYDSSTDRLIETISGNELGELVKKLNMASGIFVNKKV